MSRVRVRVPNLDPRKTRTRDTGLTGIAGIAGDCDCYITGGSSVVPSVSNHIPASGDHENEDSEREEQRRQRQGGASQVRLSFSFLLFHYLLTTPNQQKYEKWRGGTHLLVLPIFDTARRQQLHLQLPTTTTTMATTAAAAAADDSNGNGNNSCSCSCQRRRQTTTTTTAAPAAASDNGNNCRCSCQRRRQTTAARRYPPPRSAILLISTQQGGVRVHLLAGPIFSFRCSEEVYAYTPSLCHYSSFRRNEEVPNEDGYLLVVPFFRF